MKSFLSRMIVWFFIVACIFAGTGCGTAAEGTGGTPPIDIPAPVSHLSVSTPDEDGLSRVSGAAGFADAGTTVSVSNGGANAISFLDFLIGKAFAQALVVASAEADGSFQTQIAAAVGDVITATYVLDGETLTAQATVTATQPALPLSAEVQDAAVNGTGAQAGIIANDGTDGVLHLLDLDGATLTRTIALPGSSGTNRVAYDAAGAAYYAIDPANETVIAVNPADGTSVLADVPTPSDVAAGFSGGYALISHSNDEFVACYYDAASNFASSLAVLTVPGDATHVETPFIDADSDGDSDVFAVVSRMSDGNHYAALFSVANAATYAQRSVVELTGLSNPGGLALFNAGAEALVTDRLGDRVLRVNFEAGTLAEIAVGDAPEGVAVNAAGTAAFVVNGGEDTVSFVSLEDNAVTATRSVGLTPAAAATDKTGASAAILIVNDGDETATIF